ncbi:6013_t:CDS:1, partial [Gigaspora rosea]
NNSIIGFSLLDLTLLLPMPSLPNSHPCLININPMYCISWWVYSSQANFSLYLN